MDDDQRLEALEAGAIEMKAMIAELCTEVDRIIRLVEGNSSRAA